MNTFENWLLSLTAASLLIAPVCAQTSERQATLKAVAATMAANAPSRCTWTAPRTLKSAATEASCGRCPDSRRNGGGLSVPGRFPPIQVTFGLVALMAAENKNCSRTQAAAAARRLSGLRMPMAAPKATPSTCFGAAQVSFPLQPASSMAAEIAGIPPTAPPVPARMPSGRERTCSTASVTSISGADADLNPGRTDTMTGSFEVPHGNYRDTYRFSCSVDPAERQSTGRRDLARTRRGFGRSLHGTGRCHLLVPARRATANRARWLPRRSISAR